MLGQIIKIGLLCIAIGGASIPIAFTINSNPWVVWVGNALGSLVSAVVVIKIGDRITDDKFKNKASKFRIGKKVVEVFDQGDNNHKVREAQSLINKHGLKLFSLICPLFPGVLLSTTAVYILDLDKRTYKRWMFTGVVFVSGGYVFAYWWALTKVT